MTKVQGAPCPTFLSSGWNANLLSVSIQGLSGTTLFEGSTVHVVVFQYLITASIRAPTANVRPVPTLSRAAPPKLWVAKQTAKGASVRLADEEGELR
jgi:hypothetical protein